MYTYLHRCVYYIYIYIYICKHVCMCVYIYIYIYILGPRAVKVEVARGAADARAALDELLGLRNTYIHISIHIYIYIHI